MLKKNGHYITGYVIMPNHVHATIAFQKTKKSINKIIGDGKRFIGYEIIKRLKQQDQKDILLQLQNAVNSSDKKKGKLHEVWENSFESCPDDLSGGRNVTAVDSLYRNWITCTTIHLRANGSLL